VAVVPTEATEDETGRCAVDVIAVASVAAQKFFHVHTTLQSDVFQIWQSTKKSVRNVR